MSVTTPLMRLQDPDYTKVIIITLAETTPVLEAEQLHADLERADIHPWAWIVNQTLTGTDTTNPLLRQRQAAETRPLAAIQRPARRVAQVQWGDALTTPDHPKPEPWPAPTDRRGANDARRASPTSVATAQA